MSVTDPTSNHPRTASLPVQLALIAGLIIISGLTPIFTKFATAELPHLSLGAVRFGLAGVLMAITYLLWRKPGEPSLLKVERRDWPALLAAALLCVPINQACYLVGVARANASHAGLMYALNPVLVFVLSVALRRTRFSRRMAAAAALAFIGAAVLSFDGLRKTGGGNDFVTGDLLLLGAVSSWAMYLIVAKPLTDRNGPLRPLAQTLLLGALLYSPVILIDGHELKAAAVTPRAWLSFAYITVMTAYVNYILWQVAIQVGDIHRVSVGANLSPLVAVLTAWWLGGEQISWRLMLAAVLLLTALMLANWPRAAPAQASNKSG